MKCPACNGMGFIHNGVTWMEADTCYECNGEGGIKLEYTHQLRGGKLKVKLISFDWDVKVIRSDDGEEDTFPLLYFKRWFKEIK